MNLNQIKIFNWVTKCWAKVYETVPEQAVIILPNLLLCDADKILIHYLELLILITQKTNLFNNNHYYWLTIKVFNFIYLLKIIV